MANTRTFGALTSLAVLLSQAADVIVAPALLRTCAPATPTATRYR